MHGVFDGWFYKTRLLASAVLAAKCWLPLLWNHQTKFKWRSSL